METENYENPYFSTLIPCDSHQINMRTVCIYIYNIEMNDQLYTYYTCDVIQQDSSSTLL